MLVPMSIIFQSCLGSIAAFCILKESNVTVFDMIQLSITVFTCMFYNASILGQFNKRLVFKLLLLTLVANGLIVLFYIIL